MANAWMAPISRRKRDPPEEPPTPPAPSREQTLGSDFESLMQRHRRLQAHVEARGASNVAPASYPGRSSSNSAHTPRERERFVPSERELVEDYEVLRTVGDRELAKLSLDLLNNALSEGKLSLAHLRLSDNTFTRIIKGVGLFAKMKNLLPTKHSLLPITEVDLSGNDLAPRVAEASTRSVLPLQMAVQFIRTSTDARVVRLEDCNLQADDKIEAEVLRLVKKFGNGNDQRFAHEISLAGNHFEAAFAKRLIQEAWWERTKHRKAPTKFFLNLRGNKVRNPARALEELRNGETPGGPISVAATDDHPETCDRALIEVDMHDQDVRSVSPPPRPPRQRPASISPAAGLPAPPGAGLGSSSSRPRAPRGHRHEPSCEGHSPPGSNLPPPPPARRLRGEARQSSPAGVSRRGGRGTGSLSKTSSHNGPYGYGATREGAEVGSHLDSRCPSPSDYPSSHAKRLENPASRKRMHQGYTRRDQFEHDSCDEVDSRSPSCQRRGPGFRGAAGGGLGFGGGFWKRPRHT